MAALKLFFFGAGLSLGNLSGLDFSVNYVQSVQSQLLHREGMFLVTRGHQLNFFFLICMQSDLD